MKIKVARNRSLPYVANVKNQDGYLRTFTWRGAKKGQKPHVLEIEEEFVEELKSGTQAFILGELEILDEEQKESFKEMLNDDQIKDLKNNTHTREQVVEMLSSHHKTLEKELKKITNESEIKFVIEVAKQENIDKVSVRRALSKWVGVPMEMLFPEPEDVK